MSGGCIDITSKYHNGRATIGWTIQSPCTSGCNSYGSVACCYQHYHHSLRQSVDSSAEGDCSSADQCACRATIGPGLLTILDYSEQTLRQDAAILIWLNCCLKPVFMMWPTPDVDSHHFVLYPLGCEFIKPKKQKNKRNIRVNYRVGQGISYTYGSHVEEVPRGDTRDVDLPPSHCKRQ